MFGLSHTVRPWAALIACWTAAVSLVVPLPCAPNCSGSIRRVGICCADSVTGPTVVPRLGATPGSVESAGPPLGAHTDEILTQLLGFDPQQLDDLRARKVI